MSSDHSGESDSAAKILFHERFDPLEYIRTYYPDVTDIETLLIIMYLLHTNAQGEYVVDLIAEKTATERELVENIAIFDFYREVVEFLLPQFPRGDATVLDIGGGPTIYQHIAISLFAKHITHAEFLESNRKEVVSWLDKEERAHDWDSYFKLVQELFKYGKVSPLIDKFMHDDDEEVRGRAVYVKTLLDEVTQDSFKRHVRSCIGGDVVHGDIFRQDLGMGSEPSLTYDVVTANFVTESVASSLQQWNEGMHNILSHVKTGGYFIQTAITNATWYQVGGERLPATKVDQSLVNAKLKEEGFSVLYQKVLEGSDAAVVGYDGMIFILAQKPKEICLS